METFIGLAVLATSCLAGGLIILLISNEFGSGYLLQTIAAFGPIGAIGIAIWQQEKIDDRESKQREYKLVAARSLLPVALAKICDFAKLCVKEIAENHPLRTVHLEKFEVKAPPPFPEEAAKTVKECIEHAEIKDGGRLACIASSSSDLPL